MNIYHYLLQIRFHYQEADSANHTTMTETSVQSFRPSHDEPYLKICDHHSFSKHEQRKKHLYLLIALVRRQNELHHKRALNARLRSSTATNVHHLRNSLSRQAVDSNYENCHGTEKFRHICIDIGQNLLIVIGQEGRLL